MSRSYRKPYSAITGTASAKEDKRLAARGVRHRQNESLRQAFLAGDLEEFLLPNRYECPWNDVWTWGRDGKQTLQFSVSCYQASLWHNDEWEQSYHDWWLKLHRK